MKPWLSLLLCVTYKYDETKFYVDWMNNILNTELLLLWLIENEDL